MSWLIYAYIILQGLDKAIKELMPDAEHRLCTRHLAANLTKIYPLFAITNAFWNPATATHPQAFKTTTREMERVSKGAYQKIKDLRVKLFGGILRVTLYCPCHCEKI